ncbi:polysaccharide lyase 8 family protein [Chitinophagaceae bacterium LB-8]|uniref:Polysaccharide lyase 8 family protein n=1 Tax=Paraflavisolibacter caeni TaxID=2982496 RepID=A0A9X2XVD0_9BACT|nr:chondroitinase-AC [Paraflavisolibacter caeni]MCU7549252.1 polysaccharide lyase 8 family protein [Paraflavisolibacter caeni]
MCVKTSKKLFFLVILLCFNCTITNLSYAQSYHYDTIMNRVRQNIMSQSAQQDSSARFILNSIQPDGSWGDIDYNDKSAVKWKPGDHLLNLRMLITSYITGSDLKDEQLYKTIQNAFTFWYEKDPQSNNWWHNEIAMPQSLGELLILMRYAKKQLPASLEDSLIRRMKRGDPYKQTGANKTDVALHYFYRALLNRDSLLLKEAVVQLFYPIVFVHLREGLQYDGSYLQHGPQLQISSYGSVFLTGAITVASYVRGTPYALSQSKLELLSNYYRNTYLRAIRGSFIDFNVEGRGISRKNILSKYTENKRLELMALIDPQHFMEWQLAALRTEGVKPPDYKVTAYHRHFWCADYTMHLRPAYSFNIRMVSSRTKRCEMGNQENLLGRYLSDGATNLQRRGAEYDNIMPLWEWDKVPGVTNRDYTSDRPMSITWGEVGNSVFSGGVSDGIYGVSGYQLNYDSVTAKKAWFLFDKEIVCLGAGINSEAQESVTTTVNQCWINGNVLTSGKKRSVSKNEVLHLNKENKAWVLHDSIGYFFPKGSNIAISKANQTGSWYQINRVYTDQKLTGDVFKLWINHGVKPVNASYAYIILPGVQSAKEMMDFNDQLIKVIANNDSVQAVLHANLKMMQVVFYKPCTVHADSFSITVDKPCIMMVKNMDATSKNIFIADPSQKEQDITIHLVNLKTNGQKSIKMNLPENEMAGSTISINVEKM